MLQKFKTELDQEIEYLKNAAKELKALNEELTLAELFGYEINNEELIELIERSDS